MRVGFLHVDGPDLSARVLAEGMVQSVKRAMPGVAVVQFTDIMTDRVPGVDDVAHLEPESESSALLRFRHQSQVAGDWLFLDTDIIVQKDIRKVFRDTFHVAVTTRNWKHLKNSEGFSERMPFNTGVVFSRSPRFWQEAAEILAASETHDREFMGHQQIICDLALSGRYDVAYVKGSKFNCPPYVPGMKGGGSPALSDLLIQHAAIVHYKGPQRKEMMLKRIQAEGLCA